MLYENWIHLFDAALISNAFVSRTEHLYSNAKQFIQYDQVYPSTFIFFIQLAIMNKHHMYSSMWNKLK